MEIEPLIERCRHGEEDALGELYKTYAPKLRSVCRRYISNEDMVNDALHDAFVVILTSFDTLREDSMHRRTCYTKKEPPRRISEVLKMAATYSPINAVPSALLSSFETSK